MIEHDGLADIAFDVCKLIKELHSAIYSPEGIDTKNEHLQLSQKGQHHKQKYILSEG